MKKLFLVLFLLVSIIGFSQPIVQRANSSITVQDARAKPLYNQFMPTYADTTAANLQVGIDSLGAVIYTYSNHSLWVRAYSSGKRWVAVGSSSGSGTVTDFTAGNLSPLFTTNVATSTTTPALTFTLDNQLANTVFAGPTSGGAAAPTFRALVSSDITGLVTGSEGITTSGVDVRLGGTVASQAYFSTDRVVNTNRKGMYWVNGAISDLSNPGGATWAFGQTVFSPYQFLSADTITANDINPPTAAAPWSGVFGRREIYFNSGVIRAQKVFGHDFGLRWNFQDTMTFNTQGGDYNNAFRVLNEIAPRGTGRQGIRASHGTGQNNSIYFGEYALLSTTWLNNTPSNYIKVNGHMGGINSYIVMGSNNVDTLAKWVYYSTGSFVNGHIDISYDFAPASAFLTSQVDSLYGWYDTVSRKRSYHAGNYVIGPSRGTSNTWSSTDKLKVLGNVNITDTLVIGSVTAVSDSAGIDLMLRRRATGGLERIRFDQVAALIGATTTTLYTGDGSLSGNRVVTLGGNSLSLTGTAGSSITSTADSHTFNVGSEVNGNIQLGSSFIRSFDPQDDNNVGRIYTSATSLEVQTLLDANFNDGVKLAKIEALANVSAATITHTADSHTFNVATQLQAIGQGVAFLDIVPTVNSESVTLMAFNVTDDNNTGAFRGNTTATTADAQIIADFNDGVKRAQVLAYADATTSTITHTADENIFAGLVRPSADNTYALGDATHKWSELHVMGSSIKMYGTSSGVISITSAAAAGTWTMQLPADDGTPNQVLTTDGSGILTWATPAGGGNVSNTGTPLNNQLAVWTSSTVVEGDPNLTFSSSTLTLGVATSAKGVLVLSGNTSGTVTIQPLAAAGGYTLTLPPDDGNSGEVLTTNGSGVLTWAAASGTGTVTSVGWTGGIVSIATATTTPAFTIAGTSGGIPYFSSSSTWATSAALTANDLVIGGGAGAAPATTTTGTGILTWLGTPSSANLASAVTNETGSGLLTFATAPSMSSITLAAGTATAATAPMYFTSGTNLTAVVSGAVEFDGNTFYKSTASGRGVSPATMFAMQSSDFTGQNINTVQPVFATGFDAWTLQGSTTYEIEGLYYFTHGATSHALSLSFELSGGASVTSILYYAMGQVVAINTVASGQQSNLINTVASTAVTAAGANAQEIFYIKGYIRMNAGGTVTPSYTFSADPGGTVLTKTNSYIKFTPVGTNTVTNVGNVQ